MQLIVSMTSIPSRYEFLTNTIESILVQKCSVPFQIHLYLPKRYNRFGHVDSFPVFYDPRVFIHEVFEDLGPVTKLGYALEEFENTDTWILYCDDDQIYPDGWLQTFIEVSRLRRKDPLVMSGSNFAEINSARRKPRASFKGFGFRVKRLLRLVNPIGQGPWTHSGYVDIAEGWAGVLIHASWLTSKKVKEIPDSVRYVDDIWISALLAEQNKYPWLIAPGMSWEMSHGASSSDALNVACFEGQGRKQMNVNSIRLLMAHLNIWQ